MSNPPAQEGQPIFGIAPGGLGAEQCRRVRLIHLPSLTFSGWAGCSCPCPLESETLLLPLCQGCPGKPALLPPDSSYFSGNFPTRTWHKSLISSACRWLNKAPQSAGGWGECRRKSWEWSTGEHWVQGRQALGCSGGAQVQGWAGKWFLWF